MKGTIVLMPNFELASHSEKMSQLEYTSDCHFHLQPYRHCPQPGILQVAP